LAVWAVVIITVATCSVWHFCPIVQLLTVGLVTGKASSL